MRESPSPCVCQQSRVLAYFIMGRLNTRVGRFKKMQQHKREDAATAKRKKGKKKDEVPKKVAMISKPQKSGKHKKIKAIEPQYNDKKSLEANRAPSAAEDDQMTGAFREFIKLKESGKEKKKKIRRKHRLKELGPGAEFVDYAMKKEMKGMTKPLRDIPKFAQGRRESDEAFINRVENMTSLVIKKSKFEDKYKVQIEDSNKNAVQVKKNKSKRHDRQMERLKKKKAMKKEKLKEKMLSKQDLEFKNTKGSEEVEFGEQAMAPPTITAKPRKSEDRAAHRPKTGSLLLNEIIRDNKNSAGGSGSVVHSRKIGESRKRKHMSLAQQKVMDDERQRAIDLYRKMKEQKLAARS